MYDIVKLLIDEGADLNVADKNGMTATKHAAELENKSIEDLLQKSQAFLLRKGDLLSCPVLLEEDGGAVMLEDLIDDEGAESSPCKRQKKN